MASSSSFSGLLYATIGQGKFGVFLSVYSAAAGYRGFTLFFSFFVDQLLLEEFFLFGIRGLKI
jgi:hypothetical protein